MTINDKVGALPELWVIDDRTPNRKRGCREATVSGGCLPQLFLPAGRRAPAARTGSIAGPPSIQLQLQGFASA